MRSGSDSKQVTSGTPSLFEFYMHHKTEKRVHISTSNSYQNCPFPFTNKYTEFFWICISSVYFIDEDNVCHCNFSIFIDGKITYQNEEIISRPHCPGAGWLHISEGNMALPVISESIGPSLLKQGGFSLYIQSPLDKRKKKETGYITLIISYASGFLT